MKKPNHDSRPPNAHSNENALQGRVSALFSRTALQNGDQQLNLWDPQLARIAENKKKNTIESLNQSSYVPASKHSLERIQEQTMQDKD